MWPKALTTVLGRLLAGAGLLRKMCDRSGERENLEKQRGRDCLNRVTIRQHTSFELRGSELGMNAGRSFSSDAGESESLPAQRPLVQSGGAAASTRGGEQDARTIQLRHACVVGSLFVGSGPLVPAVLAQTHIQQRHATGCELGLRWEGAVNFQIWRSARSAQIVILSKRTFKAKGSCSIMFPMPLQVHPVRVSSLVLAMCSSFTNHLSEWQPRRPGLDPGSGPSGGRSSRWHGRCCDPSPPVPHIFPPGWEIFD